MTKYDELVRAAARDRLFAAELADALDVPVAATAERAERPSRAGWLAAAIVLLGVFVASGVAWLRAHEDATEAQEPATFDPVFPWYERTFDQNVAPSAAELAKLPPVEAVSTALENDEDLTFLARQTTLRQLMLTSNTVAGCSLGLDAVRAITALPKLEVVALSGGVHATAEVLRELRTAPKLDTLTLGSKFRLDAELAAALVELPKLRLLGTWETEITTEGLAALAGLPHLEVLHLGNQPIDDAIAEAISKLRTLRALMIIDKLPQNAGVPMMRLTATQMRAFGRLPRLVSLFLAQCRVDDECLESLPPNLQSLTFASVEGVTEAGLQSVARLPHLRALAIRDCGEDAAMAKRVLLARPLERFESQNEVMPAELWAALAEQPRMRNLQLRCPATGAPDLSPCAQMPALETLALSFPQSLAPEDLTPLLELPKLRSLVVIGTGRIPQLQREALASCLGPGVTVRFQ